MRRESVVVRPLAVLLVLALNLVVVQAAVAAPNTARLAQLSGKLTTTGNQSVLVNGNSMSNGGTILNGATVETPAGVGATINFGSLGSVDLAPGTTAIIEISEGVLKVKVIKGCVILRTKKGTLGEVSTEQGVVDTTDREKNDEIDMCLPPGGGNPIVNQGAASNACAGAGGCGGGIGAGAGGTEGLDKAFLAVTLGGGLGAAIIAIIITNRNDNASPS